MDSSPRQEVEVHVSRGSRGEPCGHGYAGTFATGSAFRTLTRSVILTLGSLVRTMRDPPTSPARRPFLESGQHADHCSEGQGRLVIP